MIRSSLLLYRNAYTGITQPIWWLSLVMFVNRSGTMVIPFLTVYLTHEMHFSIAEAGFVMAAFGGGAIVGAYFGGRLTDRIGFYPIQFWSLFFNGVMFFILGQMQTLWQFIICIFILSAVGESFRPANSAAIAAYSDENNRTRSYSLNRLAINLGFSIGPAVGGILSSISYQWLFWADGLTCIMAAFIMRISLRPLHTERKTNKTEVKKPPPGESVYKDKTYLKFIFSIFLVAFCFLQLFSLVPVYYKEEVGMSESLIGIVLASNGLIIAIFEMVLVYKLEGRRSALFYIGWGSVLIGLSFLVLNIGDVFAMVALSMLIITIGEMLMFPFTNTFWVARSKEHNRGQYAALFTISFALAHVLAPTVGSQIIKNFGYDTLWYTSFAICTVAAVFFFSSVKKKAVNL
jgi:predicted MFS family arabinose efflux permease